MNKKIKVPIKNRLNSIIDPYWVAAPTTYLMRITDFECYEQFYNENPDLKHWHLDQATSKYKAWLIQKVLNEL